MPDDGNQMEPNWSSGVEDLEMLAVLMIGAALAALGLELLLESHFGTELKERLVTFVTASTRRTVR
jgi:hypothetical protein